MYKVICSVCKKWILTTKKSPKFLGNINASRILDYLSGSPEFKKPKGTDQVKCPNCRVDLFPRGVLKFEVLTKTNMKGEISG